MLNKKIIAGIAVLALAITGATAALAATSAPSKESLPEGVVYMEEVEGTADDDRLIYFNEGEADEGACSPEEIQEAIRQGAIVEDETDPNGEMDHFILESK